jgi:hypothetical protein
MRDISAILMTRTSSIIHKKKLYRNEGGMGQPKRMERERERERERELGRDDETFSLLW